MGTKDGEVNGYFDFIGVDYEYFDSFDLEFVAGMGLRGNFRRIRELAIVNETAVKELGLTILKKCFIKLG